MPQRNNNDAIKLCTDEGSIQSARQTNGSCNNKVKNKNILIQLQFHIETNLQETTTCQVLV
jgi:hypothetical protein